MKTVINDTKSIDLDFLIQSLKHEFRQTNELKSKIHEINHSIGIL